MSKICFISDQHWGYRIDNNSYTDYIKRFYDEFFFPYLVDNKIDIVIQFGDLLDNRRNISIKTLKLINETFLEPLRDNNITLHTILGNHDIMMKNRSELNSPKYVLASYKNTNLYEKITEVEIGGKLFGFVPWINDENYKQFEKWSETSDADVVIGHFEFSNMEYSPGIKSERGMSLDMVSRFPEVYSGHYHISSEKGNVLYLNTPHELTFNDMGQSKGFYIYNTADSTLDFHQNPHVLFRKIIYDDTTVDYDDYDFSIYKGSYIKVYIIKRENIAMYSRFIDNLYGVDAVDINIIENDLMNEDDEDMDVEVQSTIDIIRDTVTGLTNVDRPSIIGILDNLYREAHLVGNEYSD